MASTPTITGMTWDERVTGVEDITTGYKVIDCDTHLNEAVDLWTSRAPAKFKDRVPHVRRVEAGVDAFGARRLEGGTGMTDMWFIERDQPLGPVGAVTVGPQGEKMYGRVSFENMDTMHSGAWDVKERVKFMDEVGIAGQITYPQVTGFSSVKMIQTIKDEELRFFVTTAFNDAIADFQRDSGNRIFPQALLPIWEDRDTMMAEARRCIQDLKLMGFVMGDRPELLGLPGYNDPYYEPFFEMCNAERIPLNFHLGGSNAFDATKIAWDDFGPQRKLAILSISLFMANAGFLMNFIYSGIFDRYENLKVVSVESGMGWIPFLLEAMEYQLDETIPTEIKLSRRPMEMFRDHVYATFWFEKIGIQRLTDVVPVENILFETDFPHPTCLYPKNREHASAALQGLDDYARRRILQDNAIELYHLPI